MPLTEEALGHHDREGAATGEGSAKRGRGPGRKALCKLPGCENVKIKASEAFCLDHHSIYVAGNFEIFGKPLEVIPKLQKDKPVKDAWDETCKKLVNTQKLGKLE